ncbi:MAG: hypothetical protein FWB83_07855, partial [Treponema sp.]|nr:hypothetical protein [Treponema sp.]
KKNLRIGFGLVWDGWHERELNPYYDNEKLILREWVIKRGEVHGYLSPEFYTAYKLWSRIKRYGWPHGQGWIREPAGLVELVELFDTELELLKEKNAGKR